MICRLTGKLVAVAAQHVEVQDGGLCYQVLVPVSALPELHRLIGQEITLHTLQYLDGNPAIGNLVPRIIGFPSEPEREFFNAFVKVKNIGMRKALRAMSVPAPELAAAIQRGDERFLASLPEIGKKTAAQIIAELAGRLERFLVSAPRSMPLAELTAAQQVALDILVQWGDRRADAQRWVSAAVDEDPALVEPEAIVRAAYRIKQRG